MVHLPRIIDLIHAVTSIVFRELFVLCVSFTLSPCLDLATVFLYTTYQYISSGFMYVNVNALLILFWASSKVRGVRISMAKRNIHGKEKSEDRRLAVWYGI